MIWASAFLFGFLGSLHCAGMCAPLLLAIPNEASFQKFIVNKLTYNFGRVLTYCLLGALFGVFGLGLNLIGFQQSLSLISGVLIIVFVFLPIEKSTLVKPLLSKKLKEALVKRGVSTHFTFGLLNGFLPCGLSLFALIGALSTANIQSSIVYMLIFGLGTLPVMIGIPMLGRQWKPQFLIKWNYKFFVIFIGVLLIVRGLNLGIPYLSPQIEQLDQVEKVDNNCAP